MQAPQAAVALVLLAAWAALPAHAAATGPALTLVGPEPEAGAYTMMLRVDGFTLTWDANDTAPDHGLVQYTLNGPVGAVNTNLTSHAFVNLKPGDVVRAELVNTNLSALAPPIYVERIVSNAGHPPPLPLVFISTTTPNPGDYAMTVQVRNFTIVPPGSGQPNDRSHGHLLYLLNRAPCAGDCAQGANAETDALSFTFHGLKQNDQVAVELVQNDGTPFSPVLRATQVVGLPSIFIESTAPRAGTYEMKVRVAGFTLVPPTNPPSARQAGTGHIHYLVKHGDGAFQPAPGDYATAATTFTFNDLEQGDEVAAELVNNDHSSLSPKVIVSQGVQAGAASDPLAPGVGPVLVLVLLGAALVARRRRP